jgi:hypothetical protein
MLTLKEKAINNSFQIIEDLKAPGAKKSFYYPSARSRPPLKKQLPGKVKVFSEEEVFLYKLRKYRQALLSSE